MQVSVESLGGLKRRVFVSVPSDAIESRLVNRLNEVARVAKVDGFRPGKAPAALVKKRFEPAIREEILSDVMRDSLAQAVQQAELRLVAAPSAMDAKPYLHSQPFSFTADVEVFPEINVVLLSGETLVKKVATIADDDVTKAIDSVREQHATWKQVDRPAALKDRVVMDYKGTMNGEEFVGGSADGVPLVLGSNMMIPGFESGLVGLSAGGHTTLSLTFPADYNHAEYAGKAAQFDVTVKTVEESSLPAIDETFIRQFGLKETTEEALRAEVKKNLTRALASTIKSKYKDVVVSKLLEKNVFDVPETFVKNEIHRLKRVMVQQFMQGKTVDEKLVSSLPDELCQAQAEKNVRFGLLLAEYAEKEALVVDDARVKTLIEEVAQSYDDPQAAVAWYYQHAQQLEMMKGLALEDMAIERLCAGATLQETSVSYDELMKA